MADRSPSRQHLHGEGQPDPQHTRRPRPLTAPTARSLEYWARTRPQETALVEGAHALTYAGWNDYADQLADSLADATLGAGDVLALRAATRLEWLVVAMAAAKLDIELLPLDPALPPRDLRRILIETGAAGLICDDAEPGLISPHLTGLSFKLRASIDAAAPGFRNFWDMFPAVARPRFARSQPTTITYTHRLSDTRLTGQLRAVRVPQRLIAPAALSRTPTPDEGVSLITLGAHHAYAMQQIWQALAAGRRMVVVPSYTPLAALEAIDRNRVTQWMDFAAAFQALAELAPERIGGFDLSSLRSIVVGGGGAPSALRAWLVATFGPIVSQTFGLPETGLIARLPAESPMVRPGACGRPRPGAVVEIRNRLGERLPPNAVGEVWARTPDSIERRLIGLGEGESLLDENDFVRTGVCGRLDEDGFLFLDTLTQDNGAPPASRHAPIRLVRPV